MQRRFPFRLVSEDAPETSDKSLSQNPCGTDVSPVDFRGLGIGSKPAAASAPEFSRSPAKPGVAATQDQPRTAATTAAATAAPPAQFTRQERERIFRGMVLSSLDAGFLRYSRRQELLRYAGRLGFGEFEATLLIAQAQYCSSDLDAPEPIELWQPPLTAAAALPPSLPMRMATALLIAVGLDLALIHWLF